MRRVILHYHIYKNAGTTVDSIFEQNYPGAVARIEGPDAWDTLPAARVAAFTAKNPAVRVITSHQMRFPVPRIPKVQFLPVLFLRHPLDRAASVFEFECRALANNGARQGAGDGTGKVRAYFHRRLSPAGGSVIRNFQVLYLSGRHRDMRFAVAERRDLDVALDCLGNLEFFGFVERFEDSIGAMKTYLAAHGEPLEVSFTPRNVTPNRPAGMDERLRVLRDTLGKALWQKLTRSNALDLRLYEEAQRLFHSNRLAEREIP